MQLPDLIALIRIEFPEAGVVEDDTPLLSSGIVDSFGIGALIAAIEDTAGVVLPLEHVGVDNFDTPAQILAVVAAAA